jgi:hypothetical protein
MGGETAIATAAAAMQDMVDRVRSEGAVHSVWDLAVERLSLGGLLLLRQEAELLAELGGVRTLVLHIAGADLDARKRVLVEGTWKSSYSVELRFERFGSPDYAWPSAAIGHTGFSYQFFDRVILLAAALSRRPPQLRWPSEVTEQANALLTRFGGRLVVSHLKNVADQGPEQSNANQDAWAKFFARNACPGKLNFVLLGSDAAHLSVTEDLGVPLEVQLALAGHADGFLGMASGICAAAVLSVSPYILFKHPSHHTDEMRRELSDSEHFPFAGLHQHVWRRADTVDCLAQALAEIGLAWAT